MNEIYDQERFLRLVGADLFLSRVWARDRERIPVERRDRQLRSLFNTYVSGDSVMLRAYAKS
jgi:hypothetical protein